jgi:hypothetical protein
MGWAGKKKSKGSKSGAPGPDHSGHFSQSFVFSNAWPLSLTPIFCIFKHLQFQCRPRAIFLRHWPAKVDHSGHFLLFRFSSEALLTSPAANQWFTFSNAWPYYIRHTISNTSNASAVPEPVFEASSCNVSAFYPRRTTLWNICWIFWQCPYFTSSQWRSGMRVHSLLDS